MEEELTPLPLQSSSSDINYYEEEGKEIPDEVPSTPLAWLIVP